jgi:hypothetical protein
MTQVILDKKTEEELRRARLETNQLIFESDTKKLVLFDGATNNKYETGGGVESIPGPPGPRGISGATGSSGAQGTQGYQGSQGSQGNQGLLGNRGYQGIPGSGFSGPSLTLTNGSYSTTLATDSAGRFDITPSDGYYVDVNTWSLNVCCSNQYLRIIGMAGEGNPCLASSTGYIQFRNAINGGAAALGIPDYRLADGYFTNIHSTNAVTVDSDEEKKTEIIDIPYGLEFIEKLRPVSYKWLNHEVIYDNEDPENPVKTIEMTTHDRRHFGLIGQDIEKVMDDMNIDSNDLGAYVKDDEGSLALRYEEFIAPMIKSIQELSEQNKKLLTQLEEQGIIIKGDS